MSDSERVCRSVYLPCDVDIKLRQLVHELSTNPGVSVTKSDLISAAVSLKLRDWRSILDTLRAEVTAGQLRPKA